MSSLRGVELWHKAQDGGGRAAGGGCLRGLYFTFN